MQLTVLFGRNLTINLPTQRMNRDGNVPDSPKKIPSTIRIRLTTVGIWSPRPLRLKTLRTPMAQMMKQKIWVLGLVECGWEKGLVACIVLK